MVGRQVGTLKWTAENWKEVESGRLPFRDAPDTWEVGDVEAGFKEAAVIVDETLVHQSTSHQPLEPRTAMAYWERGKLFLYGSTQSVAQTVPSIARWSGSIHRRSCSSVNSAAAGSAAKSRALTPWPFQRCFRRRSVAL
jgi:CO/xanthine dehydrogenase Mo-binding subunit